jgi:hypothetical protein
MGGERKADLGKLHGRTYLSQKDARWIVNEFRELAPQVRNLGGKIFAGKVQWIKPLSDGVFAGIDAEPDFAVNALFPVARGYRRAPRGSDTPSSCRYGTRVSVAGLSSARKQVGRPTVCRRVARCRSWFACSPTLTTL